MLRPNFPHTGICSGFPATVDMGDRQALSSSRVQSLFDHHNQAAIAALFRVITDRLSPTSATRRRRITGDVRSVLPFRLRNALRKPGVRMRVLNDRQSSCLACHRVCSRLWLRLVVQAGRAILEVLKERGIGKVLPILCLGEQPPAPVRTICGTLPTQRRPRAQAAYSFHSHPPCRFPHLIFYFCFGVIMIMTQN